MSRLQRLIRKLLAAWPSVDGRFGHADRKPLRREAYEQRFQMPLRDWLLHHQREIVYEQMSWMGARIWKNPLDIWIYQEIIHDVRPDIIIEIGSRFGGSTRFLANMLDIVGHGRVISIDVDRSEYRLEHPRVIALTGSSSDPGILSDVGALCENKSALVIQDGDHSKQQVLADLENYAGYVGLGGYFIVEDGLVDLFHPDDGLGFSEEGPLAAIEAFLARRPEFEVDQGRERYLLTYNPKGYLKRVA